MKKIEPRNKKHIVKVRIKSVEMSPKGDVILVGAGLSEKTEDEIRVLVRTIEQENQRIKRNYYSINSQVETVQNRNFFDLVKLFFNSLAYRFEYDGIKKISL